MNLTMCVIAFILTLALMIIIMPHFISYLKKGTSVRSLQNMHWKNSRRKKR